MPAPVIAIELAAKAGQFLEKNWREIGCGVAVVLVFLCLHLWGKNGELDAKLQACLERPPVVQVQYVTLTAKALQTVKVVYRNGSPCADVEAVNDSSVAVAVSQSQTAQASQPVRKLGPWSVSLGYSYTGGEQYLTAGAGYWMPSVIGDFGLTVNGVFPPVWLGNQSARVAGIEIGVSNRF